MELVILIGIQATGKSTFYIKNFFNSHVRINLDMLKTRHREAILFDACLRSRANVVIDNTNVLGENRKRFIAQALPVGYIIRGYYFSSVLEEALQRNRNRPADERIPEAGIAGMLKKLQTPSYEEGFDTLYYVQIDARHNDFAVEPWNDQPRYYSGHDNR